MSDTPDNYALNGLPENPMDSLIAEIELLQKEKQAMQAEIDKLLEFCNIVFLIAEEGESFTDMAKALDGFAQDELYKEVKKIPFEWKELNQRGEDL